MLRHWAEDPVALAGLAPSGGPRAETTAWLPSAPSGLDILCPGARPPFPQEISLGLDFTPSVLRSLRLPFPRELVIASRTHPDDPG